MLLIRPPSSPNRPTFLRFPMNTTVTPSEANSSSILAYASRLPCCLSWTRAKRKTIAKNLRLTSRLSSVNAEIGLLGSPSAPKPRRTTIALTSDYGSIHAQLHTFDGAAPFSLIARASHGTIRLAIPRSFQGLLSVSTHHGSISISDTIVQNATQLGQRGTTRRCFVGDFHLVGRDEWQGDQVEIEAPHGSIRVKYVDEVEAQGIEGVLGWLFAKL